MESNTFRESPLLSVPQDAASPPVKSSRRKSHRHRRSSKRHSSRHRHSSRDRSKKDKSRKHQRSKSLMPSSANTVWEGKEILTPTTSMIDPRLLSGDGDTDTEKPKDRHKHKRRSRSHGRSRSKSSRHRTREASESELQILPGMDSKAIQARFDMAKDVLQALRRKVDNLTRERDCLRRQLSDADVETLASPVVRMLTLTEKSVCQASKIESGEDLSKHILLVTRALCDTQPCSPMVIEEGEDEPASPVMLLPSPRQRTQLLSAPSVELKVEEITEMPMFMSRRSVDPCAVVPKGVPGADKQSGIAQAQQSQPSHGSHLTPEGAKSSYRASTPVEGQPATNAAAPIKLTSRHRQELQQLYDVIGEKLGMDFSFQDVHTPGVDARTSASNLLRL